jgi:hypothetical protein
MQLNELASEKYKNICVTSISGITIIFGQINLLHQRFLSKVKSVVGTLMETFFGLSKKDSRCHLVSKEENIIYRSFLVSKEENIIYGCYLPVFNYDYQSFGIQNRKMKVSPCSPISNQSFSAIEALVNKFLRCPQESVFTLIEYQEFEFMESEMKLKLILTIIAVFVQFIECFWNNLLAILFVIRWRRKSDCILEEIKCFILWKFYIGCRSLLLLQFHKIIGFIIIGFYGCTFNVFCGEKFQFVEKLYLDWM